MPPDPRWLRLFRPRLSRPRLPRPPRLPGPRSSRPRLPRLGRRRSSLPRPSRPPRLARPQRRRHPRAPGSAPGYGAPDPRGLRRARLPGNAGQPARSGCPGWGRVPHARLQRCPLAARRNSRHPSLSPARTLSRSLGRGWPESCPRPGPCRRSVRPWRRCTPTCRHMPPRTCTRRHRKRLVPRRRPLRWFPPRRRLLRSRLVPRRRRLPRRLLPTRWPLRRWPLCGRRRLLPTRRLPRRRVLSRPRRHPLRRRLLSRRRLLRRWILPRRRLPKPKPARRSCRRACGAARRVSSCRTACPVSGLRRRHLGRRHLCHRQTTPWCGRFRPGRSAQILRRRSLPPIRPRCLLL